MKSFAKEYCNSIKKQMWVYFANWEPSTPLKLGDYGLLKGNIFVYKGNLKDKNIKFKTRKGKEKSHKQVASRKGVNCIFNPQASVSGIKSELIKANMKIEFAKENSFFLNASGCTTSMIADKAKLGEDVIQLIEKKEFKKNYVIVTDVIESENTTIAISSGNSSSIVIEANSPQIKEINLADTKIDLKVKTENEIGYSISTTQKLVPLIGICGMRPKIFAQAEFEPVIRKLPYVTSSLLLATGKASNLAVNSAYPLDNIEVSLNNIRTRLEETSGINYFSVDFNDGVEFENENIEELIDINLVEDNMEELDEISIENASELLTKALEKLVKNNSKEIKIDVSHLIENRTQKQNKYNFGQLI